MMHRNSNKIFKFYVSRTWLIALGLLVTTLVFGKNQESQQLAKVTAQSSGPMHTLLNINGISYWVSASGVSGHNPMTDGNGLYFPRGTYGAGLLYNDGLLWGGMVNDGRQPKLRVGGVTFNSGLTQGAITSKGVAEDPNDPDVRIWRIRPDFETADLTLDAAELKERAVLSISENDIQEVKDQYQTDWETWPWQKGAPFYDTNHNGVMDSGEKPGLAGADQVIWFVANDLDESRSQSLYGSPSLGIECQVTLWGYRRNDGLGNVIFKRYRLIYKGTSQTASNATIDSLFLAIWADPDIGDHTDDYVGCDTTLNMMFAYNSGPYDAKFNAYSLDPPALGMDLFQGPLVYTGDPSDTGVFDLKHRSGYKNLGLTYFNYFAAGSGIADPDQFTYTGTQQWYNLMNGLLPRTDSPFTNALGDTSNTPLQDDPVGATGSDDVDGILYPPGDRRMEMITGPISMALGDTQEVVIAFVCGLGNSHLSSISSLKYDNLSAQESYDNGFDLAKPPQDPNLTITNLDGRVLLNWGWDVSAIRRTESGQNGYQFEGYNIYQLPSPFSPFADAKKLITFDIKNNVTTIWDSVFDVASGYVIRKPIQTGKNSGIQRTYSVEKNAFSGNSLINGTDYYFGVTAYNSHPGSDIRTRSLESVLDIKVATPHSLNPGIRFSSETGDTLPVFHTGPGDGAVQVTVVDPGQTTDHAYKIVFDSLGNDIAWYLLDTTAGDSLLVNMTDQSTNQVNPIIHGLEVNVFELGIAGINPNRIGIGYGEGSDASAKQLKGWDFFGRLWMSGHDIGGTAFNGGLVNGNDFIGSTLPRTGYVDVELYFTDDSDTSNSAAWQNAVVYRKDPGNPYPSAGLGKVPFQAWDIWNNRQLNVCFLEMDSVKTGSGNPVPANGIWDMAWDGSEFGEEGGHEVIFVMNSTYTADPTTLYNDINYGPSADILYVIWPQAKENQHYLENTFTFSIFATRENAISDIFNFTGQSGSFDLKEAQSDVKKIQVYPNPYYGINPGERTSVDRFVSFNHLPEKAIFRIFTLSGIHVRTLEKEDQTQFFRWDLRNTQGLPVASGLYIVYIEMPDLGKTKILKLALVREHEFLEIY